MSLDYEVVKSDKLSKPNDERYLVVDKKTGEILDDANGYGFRSERKAYSSYGFKQTDLYKEKIAERKRLKAHLVSLFEDENNE